MISIGWLDRLTETLSKPSRRAASRFRHLHLQSVPALIEVLEIRKCPAIVTPTLGGVSGTGTYFENSAPVPIAPALTCTNVIVGGLGGVSNIASATVNFTNWQSEDRLNFNNIFALQHTFGQDLVSHTATLTITGSDTPDHYQTLLRSVIYWNVSDAPNLATRVATFTVTSDPITGSGSTLDSNSVTRNIAISATNDPPVIANVETTSLNYKANDPAFAPLAISASLLVTDPDSNNLSKLTIQITSGYQNNAGGHDLLSFTNQNGISSSFDAATGTLTLSGNSYVGNYRSALRSVCFSTSGPSSSSAQRTITMIATDDFSPTAASSVSVTRNISVLTTNNPPAVTGIPTSALSYVRGASTVTVAPTVVVLDSDSPNLASATIQVSQNYQSGQDWVAFQSAFGVTGAFNQTTGKLTLTGMTSLANYQTLLRSVTFNTVSSSASALPRALSFTVNDGLLDSSPVSRTITLT